MAGIYIHIPFCKQTCHYCDFHFSTSVKKKPAMVEALCRELELRKEEIPGEVETIYFGGGTPSLLEKEELEKIFKVIYENYSVGADPEITLEANPDDLSEEKIKMLADSPVNRLSIGVQSFFEEDLKLMNRAHNEKEALRSIQAAKKYFDNISIDLIYGIPGMSNDRWRENLQIALDLDVPHISSYALTVEPRTALKSMIEKGKIAPVEEGPAREQYEIMIEVLEKVGFENYEFSNFGKLGYFSRNNTAYWFGKTYLGIGPSAHSFDGLRRKWNVSNNSLYIKALEKGEIPVEIEELSAKDRYNELVMTRLRTKWGVSVDEVERSFGRDYKEYLLREAARLIKDGMLEWKEGRLHVSKKGKFLSDGIAAELFRVEEE
ncbi:oxygen-independent coproporphyrinogen-3 oxidase [Salinimicrobium catena]|uniref:Heme chaperone HemW n=1 Tax=Salinimicrobium catena TaxID=390640 RepID=A0A1H5JQW9_9FLAO|nr:radical SAM family heme chaperone HemW [Salinimicrobium catena]SDK89572.1 oxygen-independent coproporphyrinogen-3 oxidase [Salinimicrobium catena]SEE54975.1 oxygen-independent coproporphyrinogen-3 oxidase [Salinimicrobium catena]